MLDGDGLDCDKLARLASALNTLADTETRVLGIRDTQEGQAPQAIVLDLRTQSQPHIGPDSPEPVAGLQPVPHLASFAASAARQRIESPGHLQGQPHPIRTPFSIFRAGCERMAAGRQGGGKEQAFLAKPLGNEHAL